MVHKDVKQLAGRCNGLTKMKKHAIIPLFIPHMGCPNHCVFCNQNTISASDAPITPLMVHEVMEAKLPHLKTLGLTTIEAAFYGGSFTGLPFATQQELLSTVKPYKQSGEIQKIRLSTRPDYINAEVLRLLQDNTVDIIELGVQSFDDEVLLLSARGHTAEQTVNACRMIRDSGFSLGIQLMIGLPGDTREKALQSTFRTVDMKPDFVRIYPTVVLADTQLAEMYQQGVYSPLPLDDAVEIVKEMVRIFSHNNIPIIRIGLKSTDNICIATDLAGAYHPAFRQLVDGALAYDDIAIQLMQMNQHHGTFLLSANPKSFSNLVGHKGLNKKRLIQQFPQMHFLTQPDSSLPENRYFITKIKND
jgi:histone acetyltransferase (RNA polymerase elongator complex component)